MDPVTSTAAEHQATRECLLRQFEAWLDRVLADEEPPGGIAAELLSALETGEAPETADEPFDLGPVSSMRSCSWGIDTHAARFAAPAGADRSGAPAGCTP
jgi:hypothetical protein